MNSNQQDLPSLIQGSLFGYEPVSLPKKAKRRKYQTFILAPHFEGLMRKYPHSRRKKSPEGSYRQEEVSFHEK